MVHSPYFVDWVLLKQIVQRSFMKGKQLPASKNRISASFQNRNKYPDFQQKDIKKQIRHLAKKASSGFAHSQR
jgi:hypothetical protein